MKIFIPYLEGVLLVGLGVSIIISTWLGFLFAFFIGFIFMVMYMD